MANVQLLGFNLTDLLYIPNEKYRGNTKYDLKQFLEFISGDLKMILTAMKCKKVNFENQIGLFSRLLWSFTQTKFKTLKRKTIFEKLKKGKKTMVAESGSSGLRNVSEKTIFFDLKRVNLES